MGRDNRETIKIDSKIINALLNEKTDISPMDIKSILDATADDDLRINNFKINQIRLILKEAYRDEVEQIIDKKISINQLFQIVDKRRKEQINVSFNSILNSYTMRLTNYLTYPDSSFDLYTIKSYFTLILDLYRFKEITSIQLKSFANKTNTVIEIIQEDGFKDKYRDRAEISFNKFSKEEIEKANEAALNNLYQFIDIHLREYFHIFNGKVIYNE